VTLIREAERLTGQTLGISTAGLLDKGSKAWVEFSMPEALHDSLSGLDYRPNLLKADSMDGSMSLTTAFTINATVCMNTLRWNLLESKDAGRLVKRKHTSGVVNGSLEDERAALGVLEHIDHEFVAGLHALIEQSVTDKQVIEVLDVIKPLPEEKGRGRTEAEKFREEWLDMYNVNPMASPWKGTAFGVVQADNTMRHWTAPRRGNRWEGNVWRAISGQTAKEDQGIVQALEKVLANA
jgi:phage/plasmid-like protein (TIGR03299 family)